MKSADKATREVAVVDESVWIICDSSWPCACVRQDDFSDVERLRIDLPDLIAAEFAKVGRAVWSDDDAIRKSVGKTPKFLAALDYAFCSALSSFVVEIR